MYLPTFRSADSNLFEPYGFDAHRLNTHLQKINAVFVIKGHYVDNGFDIIPVNPTASKILGKKCYDSVSEIDDEIEIIDIFRPSEQVLQFVEEAIKKKPKVIWLQEGIHNFEAEELARKEGIMVVFNRCMLAEHQRLY
jgi:hypothetical protein